MRLFQQRRYIIIIGNANVVKKFILILIISFFVMQLYHYLGNPIDVYLFKLGLPRTLFKSFLHFAFFFFAFLILSKPSKDNKLFNFISILALALILAIGEEALDILKGFKPSGIDILLDVSGAVLGYLVVSGLKAGFCKVGVGYRGDC